MAITQNMLQARLARGYAFKTSHREIIYVRIQNGSNSSKYCSENEKT